MQAKELAATGRYEDSRSIELVFRVRGETGLSFDPQFRSTLDELCVQGRKTRQRPSEEGAAVEDDAPVEQTPGCPLGYA